MVNLSQLHFMEKLGKIIPERTEKMLRCLELNLQIASARISNIFSLINYMHFRSEEV